MVAIKSSLEGRLAIAVMPEDRPTVANAEVDSNKGVYSGGGDSAVMGRINNHAAGQQNRQEPDEHNGQRLVDHLPLDFMFHNNRIVVTPCYRNAVIISTTIVVTLMPPPVEPGAAPINIRPMERTLLISFIEAMSMLLKPAVRVETD